MCPMLHMWLNGWTNRPNQTKPNLKFTYNLGVPVIYIQVHSLPSTGSVNSSTTVSLALLSLPSNRSSLVQILQFTQHPKLDSHNLRNLIPNLAHLEG